MGNVLSAWRSVLWYFLLLEHFVPDGTCLIWNNFKFKMLKKDNLNLHCTQAVTQMPLEHCAFKYALGALYDLEYCSRLYMIICPWSMSLEHSLGPNFRNINGEDMGKYTTIYCNVLNWYPDPGHLCNDKWVTFFRCNDTLGRCKYWATFSVYDPGYGKTTLPILSAFIHPISSHS